MQLSLSSQKSAEREKQAASEQLAARPARLNEYPFGLDRDAVTVRETSAAAVALRQVSLRVVGRSERAKLTSDIGARRVVHHFPKAGVAEPGELMRDAGRIADLYHARRPRAAIDVVEEGEVTLRKVGDVTLEYEQVAFLFRCEGLEGRSPSCPAGHRVDRRRAAMCVGGMP